MYCRAVLFIRDVPCSEDTACGMKTPPSLGELLLSNRIGFARSIYYAYARLSRTLMRVAPRAGIIEARIEMTITIPSQMRTASQLYR